MYWWETFIESAFKKSLQNTDLEKFKYKDYILYLNSEFCGILNGIKDTELEKFKYKLIGLCGKYKIRLDNIYGIFLDSNLYLSDQSRSINFLFNLFTELSYLGFRSKNYELDEDSDFYNNLFNNEIKNLNKDVILIYYNKYDKLKGSYINYKNNKFNFVNNVTIKYPQNNMFDAINFEISYEIFED